MSADRLIKDSGFLQVMDKLSFSIYQGVPLEESEIISEIEVLRLKYSFDQMNAEQITRLIESTDGFQRINGRYSLGNNAEDINACEVACAAGYLACLLIGAEYCYDIYQSCLLVCRSIEPTL
ncbi:MAG: hypothetical protein R3D00_00020 [Bacteroidia bacterium]